MSGKRFVFDGDDKSVSCVSDCRLCVVRSIDQLYDFYRVSWVVYKDDALWVAPLWVEVCDFFSLKNPFWNHTKTQLFVVYKNNIPVGRIACFIDSFIAETVEKGVGFFGFFECIDDTGIAKMLFEAAGDWLACHDMKSMRGPINGRVDMGCGFQYSGFDVAPAYLVSHTPPYYLGFADDFDLKKSRDQFVYCIDLSKPTAEVLGEAVQSCEEKGFSIRCFRRFAIKDEMKWWMPLMKETFQHHWCYIDVGEEEILNRFGVKDLFWTVDPELFMVLLFEGRPVGFKWSLPDYNQLLKRFNGKLGVWQMLQFLMLQRRITRGKFNLVGIEKQFRRMGVGSFMNYYTIELMKKRGYTSASCGWIDEKNVASCRTIEKAGAKISEKFRVFEKKIDG